MAKSGWPCWGCGTEIASPMYQLLEITEKRRGDYAWSGNKLHVGICIDCASKVRDLMDSIRQEAHSHD